MVSNQVCSCSHLKFFFEILENVDRNQIIVHSLTRLFEYSVNCMLPYRFFLIANHIKIFFIKYILLQHKLKYGEKSWRSHGFHFSKRGHRRVIDYAKNYEVIRQLWIFDFLLGKIQVRLYWATKSTNFSISNIKEFMNFFFQNFTLDPFLTPEILQK